MKEREGYKISVDPAAENGDYSCKVYYLQREDGIIEVAKVEYRPKENEE